MYQGQSLVSTSTKQGHSPRASSTVWGFSRGEMWQPEAFWRTMSRVGSGFAIGGARSQPWSVVNMSRHQTLHKFSRAKDQSSCTGSRSTVAHWSISALRSLSCRLTCLIAITVLVTLQPMIPHSGQCKWARTSQALGGFCCIPNTLGLPMGQARCASSTPSTLQVQYTRLDVLEEGQQRQSHCHLIQFQKLCFEDFPETSNLSERKPRRMGSVVAAGGLCFILWMRSTSPLSQASTLQSKAQSAHAFFGKHQPRSLASQSRSSVEWTHTLPSSKFLLSPPCMMSKRHLPSDLCPKSCKWGYTILWTHLCNDHRRN